MSDDSNALWSTALKHRIQLYRAQVHRHFEVKSPAGRRSLLSDIDETIAALGDFVGELKSYTNALAPVSLLSPEILALIFHHLSEELPLISHSVEGFVREEDNEHSSGPGEWNGRSRAYTSPLSTWVKVTHVSRYWREVALGDASLWTRISTDFGQTWANSLLERGGSTAITLHLGDHLLPDFHDDHPIWKSALSRARAVIITNCVSEWRSRLVVHNPKSLVKFSVNPSTSQGNSPRRLEPNCPLQFFADDAHGLRELSLCGYLQYDWSSPLLCTGLTSLKLGTKSNYWVQFSAPLQAILDTLSRLQDLRSLTLIGFGHIAKPSHPDAVRLPRLQMLRLEDCHPLTMLTFFDAIVTPVNAKIYLIPHYASRRLFNATKFLEILERRLSSPPWNDIQTVVLASTAYLPTFIQLAIPDNKDSLTLLAWRADFDAHDIFRVERKDQMRAREPDLYLRWHWETNHPAALEDFPHRILCLFEHLPVCTLGLLSDPYLFADSLGWAELRHAFPALRHLLLSNNISMEVVRLMYMDCEEATKSHATMKQSELKKISFMGGRESWAQHWIDPVHELEDVESYSYAQLLECVHQARSDRGLKMDIFVDSTHLESGAFDSMSDKSVLQGIPFMDGEAERMHQLAATFLSRFGL